MNHTNPSTDNKTQDTPALRMRTDLTSYIVPILIAAGCLFIVLCGLLAFASSRALPGDALYKTKTGIIEPMVGATKFSSIGEAHYSMSLLEKRLTELERLRTDDATSTHETLTAFAEVRDRGVARADLSLSNMRRHSRKDARDSLSDSDSHRCSHGTLSHDV